MNWKKRAIACFIAAVMITASMSSVVAQNSSDTNAQTSPAGQNNLVSNADLAAYTPVELSQYDGAAARTSNDMDEAASYLISKIKAGDPANDPTIVVTDKSGKKWPAILVDISTYKIPKTKAANLFERIIYTNPDLFYVEGIYTLEEKNLSTVAISYRGTDSELKRQKNLFEQNVQSALKSLSDDMTDKEKIIALHDYIVTTTHYDHSAVKSNNPVSYTAYGVFGENRAATCNGYALAFNVLMNEIGLKNNYFIGSQKADHAWSMVELDGAWYHIDPTWDEDAGSKPDSDHFGTVSHKNLLVSDTHMVQTDHGYRGNGSNDGWAITAYGWAAPEAKMQHKDYTSWSGITSTMVYKGSGEWFYVKGGKLCAGKDSSVLANGVVNTFGKWGDRLYYATNTAIRSVKLDGTDDRLVRSVSGVTGMCVANGSIYYQLNQKGNEISFEIPATPTIKSVKFEKYPALYYKEGNTFDVEGSYLAVTYSDGSVKYVWLTNEMCSKPDMNKPGTQTVTVNYEGFTLQFDITVAAKKLTSISMAPNYKAEYKIGQDLDYSSMTMILHYDNGMEQTMPVTASMVSGYDKNKEGAQTPILSYGGCTTNFAVQVHEKLITTIELLSRPDKTEYLEGSALDMKGAKLKISYDNGTSETLDTVPVSWCTGYDRNKVGTQAVTVVYNNYTAKSVQFNVTVIAKTATKFTVGTPTVTEYIEGQAFSATGALLRVDYNNGTSENVRITDDMCSGFDMGEVGEQTVNVTWNNQVVGSFPINVRAKQVSGIELTAPETVDYLAGDAFSTEGGKLAVSYDNGTKEVIDLEAAMCSAADMDQAGTQTITVSYGGKQAQFDINVTAREAVDAVDAMIDAIDLDSLTAEDAEQIRQIADAFEQLTPFEQSRVKGFEKLFDAVEKINALLYPAIEVTEGDITVSADILEFPAGTEISIVPQQALLTDSLKALFGENASLLNLFDLTVESQQELDGSGRMTVSVKLGEKTERLALAYLDAKGKATEITDFTAEDGVLSFTTNEFGRYALVQKAETQQPDPKPNPTPSKPTPKPTGGSKKTPKTGETNPIGAAVPAVMLSVSAAVLFKKRRRDEK